MENNIDNITQNIESNIENITTNKTVENKKQEKTKNIFEDKEFVLIKKI
jgi:hypothetical protein